MLLWLLPASVHAASLDSLELGGPWGSPGTTEPTALWWNPAGLAAGEGTRLLLEGAPTFARVDITRSEPHGGADHLVLNGVLPFAGIASDLTVPGLGLGLGVGVPFVRGGAQAPEGGPVRYHLREGRVEAIALMAGGGYEIKDILALGAAVHVMKSGWDARLDNELMTDLGDQIELLGQDPGYTDADLEDPDYAATLDFQELQDWAVTAAFGLQVRPHPVLDLALTWVRGFHVDNAGELDMTFSCPPQEDTLGRFGAESKGLCDSSLSGAATVGYDLPGRWQGSVTVRPVPELSLEAMGGVVDWSVFDDYDIAITEVGARNPELPQDTVALLERTQTWARDNQDSFWLGLDAKGRLQERYTFGGRLLYDKAAVPPWALLANNYDADSVILGGSFAARVVGPQHLGLSWSHTFLATRTVTDSAFSMHVAPEERPETRYNYPHGNGVYAGSVDRLGLALKLDFPPGGEPLSRSTRR